MGFIKRIFQLSLSKREIVRSKRFMAILMIPIFVIQMSSLNLFLMQAVIAEDGESDVVVESEEIKEAPPEEEPAPDEIEKADPPKEEVKPANVEEAPADKEAPVVLGEIISSSISEVIDEVKEEIPPVVDPEIIQEEVMENDEGGRITPEAAYDENLEAPAQASVVEEPKVEEGWIDNSDGSSSIMVTAGNEYTYKDSGLKIKFTRIDNGTGEITVKEIELTPEQVLELGALSNKAWDITSDMADGTFEYELTLPVEESVDESKIQLVYAEEKEDLNDEEKIKTVEKEDVKVDGEKNELTANGLDHFTVFAIASLERVDLSPPVSNGATIEGSCIEDAAGINLQCTANDVSIANVSNVLIIDDGCTSPSDDVTFKANWNVQAGANQRYDIGLYFPIEGQNSARTGSCSVTTLDNHPSPPWFNFDGDACGDINQNTLLQPEITLTVACSDSDSDNLLNLPYCTSWDNNTSGTCNGPSDAVPGTGSKCNCNNGFSVPITVPYAAEIEVIKDLVPSTNEGRFSLQIDGVDKATNVGDGGTTGKVIVGAGTSENPGDAHTVSESAYSGTNIYDYTSSISCVDRGTNTFNGGSPLVISGAGPLDVPVQKDDDIVCTATNSINKATITINKIVKNDNGGGATINDFQAKLDGNNVSWATPIDVLPGTYVVSETNLPGYVATFSGDCDGSGSVTVNSQENKTCTITNDDQPGTLIVKKEITNGNGGNNVCQDFSFNYGTGAINFQEDCQNEISVPAGIYNVTETPAIGYTTTYENCSGVVVPNGGSATCTIKNDDIAPNLTVIKKVINDNGGNETVDAFEIKMNDSALSFGVGVPSGDTTTYTANPTVTANTSYTLSEKDLSGYVEGTWSCKTVTGASVAHPVTLTEGQDVICEITNDDIAPTITLIKDVVKNNGGTAGVNSFGLSIGGVAVSSGQVYPVKANTAYSLNEAGLSGYEFVSITGDAKCPIALGGTATLNEGENITCTITNDDQSPKLHLRKIVTSNNGGTATVADFTLTADGSGLNDVSGTSPVDSDGTLQADTFILSETGPAGYLGGEWVCSGDGIQSGASITLGLGEEATCTITNDDQAAHLKLIKKVINDNDGKAVAEDFTLSASGPTPLTGDGVVESDVNAGTYALSETTNLTGYEAGDWSCTNGVIVNENKEITLALGQSTVCSITNDDIQPKLTVTKIVNNSTYGDLTVADFPLYVGATSVISGVQNKFNVGSYIIFETGKPGYSAEISGDCSANGNIILNPGDVKSCTITNTDNQGKIIIEKQTLPDGDAQSFNFSGDVAGSIADGGTLEKIVIPGNYSVSEIVPSGWDLTSLACNDENSKVSTTAGNTANVNVEANETVKCIFTNTQRSSITIKKNAIPDGASNFTFTRNFGANFQLDDDVDPNLQNEITFNNLIPGNYSVTENPYVEWILSDLKCSDPSNDSTVSLEERRTNIALGAGEAVICEFTNTQRGTVKIIKNTLGGDGTFGFNSEALPDSDFDITTVSQLGSKIYNNLQPGVYDVWEIVPVDWDLTGLSCNDPDRGSGVDLINKNVLVDLDPGEMVTCTFTNTKKSNLTVVKKVINDNGGTKTVDEFGINFSGGALNFDAGVPLGSTTTYASQTLTVDPGSYTLSENDVAGYTEGAWDCGIVGASGISTSVILAPGENKTCTITNDDQQAYINVNKTVNNDNGGNAKPDDFLLTLEGNATNSGVEIPVNPGTYTADETLLPGYTFVGFSGDCDSNGDVVVVLGERKTCTLTNDDVAPKLTLIKAIDNGDGGDATPDDFKLTVGGNGVISGVENIYTANTPYIINETQLEGYEFVSIIGDQKCPTALGGTITLDEGDDITCTITNNDTAPSLSVIKKVINDNGGNETVDAFEIKMNDSALSFGVGVPSGDTTTYTANPTVTANTSYTLSEKDLAGYTEGTWSCKTVTGAPVAHPVTLTEGQDVICEITNNDIAPELKLIKNVTNDNNGNQVAGDWTLTAQGTELGFSDKGDSVNFHDVEAGVTYNLSESGPSGYTESWWSCDGGQASGNTVLLKPGEEVTCTITNDDVAPKLTLIKDPTNDNGGNALPDDFKLTIGGNPAISGKPYVLDANKPYAINETQLEGYEFTSITGRGCPTNLGDTITLNEGDDITCTITNDDIAPTITLIKEIMGSSADSVNSFGLTIGDVAVDSGVKTNVLANTPIALNEVGLAGYTFTSLTGDEGCPSALGDTVALGEGEYITCKITNTRDTGSITVNKIIDMDGNLETVEDQLPGANWKFDVDPYTRDTTYAPASSTDIEGRALFPNLNTGYYSVIETTQTGYDLVKAECDVEYSQFKQVDSSVINVSVAKEGNTTCNFYNVPNGTIHGYKWDDLNGNRERDCKSEEGDDDFEPSILCEREDLLPGWTINLYKSNGEGGFGSEPIKTMVTDNSEEHFGWYWFENLLPGQYKVCEVLQNGWTPIYPTTDNDDNCHLVTLPDDNSNGFNESLNAVEGPEYNFGNQFVEPELTILKYNNQWPTVQSQGNIIDYTIEVKALENNVNEVKVTDLPPEGFKYLSGSWSAYSSLGGGHIGNLKLDHIYASPGVWDLGDMKAGEVVTLSYKAQIDGDQQPGLYNDLAWADGEDDRSARVLASSMPAPAVDPGEITDNFVGTQIELAVAPAPQNVELEEDEETETKTKKKVLGVTTYLPATGTPTMWIILALVILIAGIGLIIFARRKNNKFKDMTDKTLMLLVIVTGMIFVGSSAQAMAPAIRLSQPDTPTEISNQEIGFVVLDIEGRAITVDCYKKGAADPDWIKFSTVNLQAGGSSGVCLINLNNDGVYDFYAEASADGEKSDSAPVSLSLNTAVPGTPLDYDRDDDSCTVTFKTANDGGLTKQVVMYRSKNTEFIADESTRVQSGDFGSDVAGSLTDSNGNCDDYFYAIQAVSGAGIGSDFVGDEDVDVETRTRTRTVYEENIVYTGGGAIPTEGTTGGAVTEEATETTTEGEVLEGGAVQGEATEGSLSEGVEADQGKVAGIFSEKNSKWGWILVGLAALGSAYYIMRRKSKKKIEIPNDED